MHAGPRGGGIRGGRPVEREVDGGGQFEAGWDRACGPLLDGLEVGV
jgi:hypothetical protein